MSQCLSHHGIKGQRWGIIRTPQQLGYDAPKKKNARQSSEPKAKESQQETARKRAIKTKKVIAAVGAVAFTAAVAYAVGKHINREYVGAVIKKGSFAQRIIEGRGSRLDPGTKYDGTDMSGPRYISFKKGDNLRYRGLYASQMFSRVNEQMDLLKPQKMRLRATDDIKVAPNHVARKAFQELMNSDKDFANDVKQIVPKYLNPLASKSRNNVIRKAGDSMSGKKVFGGKKAEYDAFNIALMGNTGQMQKFYAKLKQMGYHGIFDMNDMKYSGYKSSKPVVLFDSKGFAKDAVEDVLRSNAVKDAGSARKRIEVQNALPILAEMGLITSVYAGASAKTMELEDERKQNEKKAR